MTITRESARCFMPYPDAPVEHAASGPLAGLSFAVKDLFNVAGYPTGGGNPHVLALSGIKAAHAATVAKLLGAGARFAGKTHTDELAFSMNGQNAHYGAPVNGAAPDRITGGSSSGSASAVSNQFCDFAIGTDTGGSIRTPANHCNLYGIRPTHGRISLAGALDLAPGFDTCGFFTRDAATFKKVADVLLGADSAPLPAKPRLLLADDVFGLLSAAVLQSQQPALQKLRGQLGEMTPVQAGLPDFDTLYWAFRRIQGWEAWRVDGAMIEKYGLMLGSGVKERFAWSKAVTQQQFEESSAIREQYRAMLGKLLGSNGVLVLPTMPGPAPLSSTPEAELDAYRNDAIRMLCLSGLAGFPQISLPLGAHDGAPLGISILGPAGSDASLVAIAARLVDGVPLNA